MLQDNDSCDDPSIINQYNLYQKEQDSNCSLNQLSCSFQFLKHVINQDIDHFLDFIWFYKVYDGIATLTFVNILDSIFKTELKSSIFYYAFLIRLNYTVQ
ncbi:unnamed protein product [Cunninghamella blakesleeana]